MEPDAPKPKPAAPSAGTFFFVLGLIVLCAGTLAILPTWDYDPNAAPICDGKPMTTRDVCMDFGGGGGDYEEMKAEAAKNNEQFTLARNIGLVGGPPFMILGVVLWIRALRRYVELHAPPADQPSAPDPGQS